MNQKNRASAGSKPFLRRAPRRSDSRGTAGTRIGSENNMKDPRYAVYDISGKSEDAP
jgi:hypothetical protein